MQIDSLDIILGFFEGFALILSPCILPILPLVLAGACSGNKQRPFGITCGFVMVFVLTAFFSRELVIYLHVDFNKLRIISYLLLILIGGLMLSTTLTDALNRALHRLLYPFLPSQSLVSPSGGFFQGILFGGLIAVVWTPCAGPILAAIIVQTVIQQSTWISFITLFTFTLGAAIPMLLIALYGKSILNQFPMLKTKSVLIRRLLGMTIIISVCNMIVQEHMDRSTPTFTTPVKTATELQHGLWVPYSAPPIQGISAWINSPPLTLSALKGQVVLIDFWTYSCINCIRTLPYLNHLNQQYGHLGLQLIGVHTPEFEFEKNQENVATAIKHDGILYPVALDNQYMTWRNYDNHYWPAHYLINQEGKVVYTHFGEGEYDVLENNIRFLLGIKGIAIPAKNKINTASNSQQTPETYLGYTRADIKFHPTTWIKNQPYTYQFPPSLPRHAWGLRGEWQVMPDHITSTGSNAAIKIHTYARTVYAVMGSDTKQPITVHIHNTTGKKQTLHIKDQSIYTLLSQDAVKDTILTLSADTPGLTLYTFTFGP